MTAGQLDGRLLNHYRVIEKIGSGGMGEVYRALDTRLDRDVALKTITESLDTRSDAFARFQREARTLASLNDPRIAAIHGFEEDEGIPFLVLEFVPGEDLAERLTRGPLPIDEALEIASEVAQALEASHARGVIHRDLKPANVKLTPEGKPKVLDFGLAKAFDRKIASPESTAVTSDDLRTQGIVGTGPYMSPEQARGRPLDKRTDIWSFGCLLYEMITGVQAFGGRTLSDTVARVLQNEPDWETLPAETPPSIRRLLRRCLQKDVDRRLHDVGDARIEIEEACEDAARGASLDQAISSVPVGTGKFGKRRLALVAPVALIVLAAFIAGWFLKKGSAPSATPGRGPVTRFIVDDPLPYWRPSPNDTPSLALSPDGTILVYLAESERYKQLYMRRTNSLESVPLAGTREARGIFFSPDSEWLGYFAAYNDLVKVSLRGGTAIRIGSSGLPRGASWSSDGSIIYCPIPEAGLMRIPAGGGEPEQLTLPDRARGERSHRWPHVLPSGKAVLFTVATAGITSFDDARIDVLSLETGERHSLVDHGTYPIYAPTGHLLYVHRGTLMAASFDVDRLELTSAPVDVLPRIVTHPNAGSAQLAISDQGTLAYLQGKPKVPVRSIVWTDRDGNSTPVIDERRAFSTATISPDGRRLATDVDGACSHIWIHDLERGTRTRLTLEWSNTNPIWTPDGQRVTFSSDRDGFGSIYWKAVDGTGVTERLTRSDHKQWPSSWTPDGKTLVFQEQDDEVNTDIWILEIGEERKVRPLLTTAYAELSPSFSPDGKWLAYASNEAGPSEVYVQPYPGDGRRWTVSTAGGAYPRWSADGKELYFVVGTKIYASSVGPGPDFGVPEPLFDSGPSQPIFDVSDDGRFITVRLEEQSERAPIHVVVNWFEELKQLSPIP